MRDFSRDHRWLSINTATVRKQGDLVAIVDACARLGIRAVSPWRDQVAHVGLDKAVKAVRDAGLDLSGYCRGGMFTPTRRICRRRATTIAARWMRPKRSARLPRAGGRRLAAIFTPGSAASKDIGAAQLWSRTKSACSFDMRAGPSAARDRAAASDVRRRSRLRETTRQALDICDRLDPAKGGMLGVALDVYHVWWDFRAVRADQARRKSACSPSMLRLAGADQGSAARPRHDGRRRHRYPQARAAVEAEGFCRLRRGRDFFRALVVRPMEDVLKTCIERHRAVV
jgi:sugar phosphate isomerase/epimerase